MWFFAQQNKIKTSHNRHEKILNFFSSLLSQIEREMNEENEFLLYLWEIDWDIMMIVLCWYRDKRFFLKKKFNSISSTRPRSHIYPTWIIRKKRIKCSKVIKHSLHLFALFFLVFESKDFSIFLFTKKERTKS